MKRRRWLALVIVMVVAAVTIAVVMRGPRPVEAPEPASASAPTGTVKFLMEQQWLVRMKLAKAEPKTVARQITATGRVVPAAGRHVVVAPAVSGLLTGTALPRVGQRVGRGDTLAIVRQMPTAAETAQIEAGQTQVLIERARLEAERRRLAESVRETEIRRNHARAELERAQRLYEGKAYSQRQLQAAETELETANSTHAAAVAQRDAVSAVRADRLPGGQVSTAYTVTAPIAGIVVRVAKPLGAQVAPGDAIVEIVDLDTVWIEAPIFEGDLSRLTPGAQASFTTPVQPGIELRGRLVSVGAVVNEQTRTVPAVFEVANPQHTLRIGLQAQVRLDAGEALPALMIPKEAVLEHEGKRMVYVLVTGEEFARREVTVGDEYGDRVAILSGLKPGERVVTQGAYQLRLQELRPATPGAHSHET